MDRPRLDELARCCADLNRELHQSGEMAQAAAEIQCAAEDLKLLGRVLVETRANLLVLSRLHALRLRARFAPPEAVPARDGQIQSGIESPIEWRNRGGFYGDN
jgi:hypothetical protein